MTPPFGDVEGFHDKEFSDRWGPKQSRTVTPAGYGSTPGNLGNLRADERGFAAAVSSPPYEGNQVGRGEPGLRKSTGGSNGEPDKVLDAMQFGYSDTPENIGNDSGDNFWSAAREIVAQTYAALRPGGHACWVVKSFVRNKQIVDFPGQWRALCESVGFVTLHEHRALLTEDRGTQYALDGNHKRNMTERKSFFRRLAEKKGSPRIDFEVVLCMVKHVV